MKVTSRHNLLQSLASAGLDPSLAAQPLLPEQVCNPVAQQVAQKFLSGELDWLSADAVINHLHFVMLECAEVPTCAWAVYEAFDAGEYHPDDPESTDEQVTRSLLEEISHGWHCA